MNPNSSRELSAWETRFEQILPLFGHRNFIVIADAAYPAQANPGIETIATGTDHTEILDTVLHSIKTSNHIRAKVYLDSELKLVNESDAPGVNALRRDLAKLLAGQSVVELEHEGLIARLDQSAQLFSVLILKSTLTIPYSSVFLELDCGYWNDEAENRLRMQGKKNGPIPCIPTSITGK